MYGELHGEQHGETNRQKKQIFKNKNKLDGRRNASQKIIIFKNKGKLTWKIFRKIFMENLIYYLTNIYNYSTIKKIKEDNNNQKENGGIKNETAYKKFIV